MVNTSNTEISKRAQIREHGVGTVNGENYPKPRPILYHGTLDQICGAREFWGIRRNHPLPDGETKSMLSIELMQNWAYKYR